MQQIFMPLNSATRRLPVWAVYLLGVLPFVWLVVQLFTGQLGVDPVKAIEHALGLYGLYFLVGGLAITPARKFLGLNLIKYRRAIGVLSFFYVATHLAVWLVLDIQLRWGEIWDDILKRPYITIGMLSFLALLPLALTSNNASVRKLGSQAWRNLHKLTYVAVPLGAVHYIMIVKGWQIEPLLWLGAILVLLFLRRFR
ncbi:protein-methionine-sulfoxide reductase heme-binding subunit MsrQ [Rhodobacteraceae bacterium MYP1-1]|uniref:Protein-methionine-sulfoxide reductase heme-binding subunit MsrQ n=2 Tax=Halocynthiibacter styelae TaxID=2761955 RepID=A0A8J7IR04_9RHOB|nr:protein-methionine-sulfoxide reductase heme-binding subunit MsrQ [Paenihalocynthiibacter styelae]